MVVVQHLNPFCGRYDINTALLVLRVLPGVLLIGHGLQKLVPAIQTGDIQRGGAGVRAQAVSPNGSLVDDFRISVTEGAVHVVNTPSPAATASLAIGRHIAGLAGDTFRL